MQSEKLMSVIQQNTPCYIYDQRTITARCRELRNAMPDVQLLYSVKANPFLPVVKTIAAEHYGADAASSDEVLLAERAGMPRELIFYSAPGKTDLDIARAWGKCIFIADSLGELARLERKAAAAKEYIEVGVRVNPAFSMDTGTASPSKFGIDEEALLQRPAHFSHVKITGIHVHIQSQVLDAEILSAYYRNCYALAERISESVGYNIGFINFGSGIGTVYDMKTQKPLDLSVISQTMQELTDQNRRGLQAKFYAETGRFVVCNSGTYYTKVIDRKESRGKVYLVVQNAMNGFIRPAIAELLWQNVGAYPRKGQEPLYTSGAACPIQVMNQAEEVEMVDIVGNLCTSLDVLARDIILPKADVGDIIAVENAGSYGYTLSPQSFSGHVPPQEILWKG